MQGTRDDIKRDILQSALALASFEGWTSSMLARAATQVGYEGIVAQRVFPGGVADILDFYAAEADRTMLEAAAQAGLAEMKVRERIKTCVRLRLEQQLPHREAIRRALPHGMLPGNLLTSSRLLWRTASEIWYAAGDTSTDFNWYTKRGLLCKVYGTTLMYWLGDNSEGQQDTWKFLDRRIEEVMQLGKVIAKFRWKMPERFKADPARH